MNIVALIPARAGSKRVPGKNTRLLGGKPLIQWTLDAAIDSGLFADIQIWSDDPEVHQQFPLRSYMREPSADDEPDIAWVRVWAINDPPPAFAVLRPTSPFRTAATLTRAYKQFIASRCSSLRAVEPVTQHPGKMWQVRGSRMAPLLDEWPGPLGEAPMTAGRTPWHSMPTQSLPQVYVQNASLEIAWTWCVTHFDSISGPTVAPFFTDTLEGFDINTETDWQEAERIVTQRLQLSV